MRRITLFLTAAVVCLQLAAQGRPARPRITGIDHVRIYSSSFEKSHEFNTKIVGLPSGGGGCAGVSRPCFPVNVVPVQQIELEQAPSPAPRNWLAEVTFATNDVARMRRYLLAHGVAPGAISKDSNGAQQFVLRDPEGNPIAFIQRPETAVNYRTSGNQVGTRIFHAGFVVHDRLAEDHFYKDILGFHLYWQGGRKDDETDWVNTQVPDGTDWIEYMLNVPADATHKTLGVMNHIALGVPDIHAAEAQLRKNGWTGTEEPKIGRGGKWQLSVYDPDDTRVELMEFTPAQKPCCSEYTGPHPKP